MITLIWHQLFIRTFHSREIFVVQRIHTGIVCWEQKLELSHHSSRILSSSDDGVPLVFPRIISSFSLSIIDSSTNLAHIDIQFTQVRPFNFLPSNCFFWQKFHFLRSEQMFLNDFSAETKSTAEKSCENVFFKLEKWILLSHSFDDFDTKCWTEDYFDGINDNTLRVLKFFLQIPVFMKGSRKDMIEALLDVNKDSKYSPETLRILSMWSYFIDFSLPSETLFEWKIETSHQS